MNEIWRLAARVSASNKGFSGLNDYFLRVIYFL
jgi:hypothetical protein